MLSVQSTRVLQIPLIILNKCSNVNIEWIYGMLKLHCTICIRNGKSVSTHDINDDVDNDVHCPA